MLRLYGVGLEVAASDLDACAPPRSHISRALTGTQSVQVPVRMDPSFDLQKTLNIGRMVEQWGSVPLAYLEDLAKMEFSYGYIGSEDWTMFPILPPCSFIQVDESQNRIAEGGWRSEYERPIYFIETRDSHVCCWCTLAGDAIILQPHPLSPVPPRVLSYPQEAEVIGQVVGVAMKLGEWRSVPDIAPAKRARSTELRWRAEPAPGSLGSNSLSFAANS